MALEGGVDQMCVVPVGLGDGLFEPLAVPLGREAQDPARHRDRHPDRGTGRGQFTDERETISRQVRMGQVGSCLAQHFILLLEQPVALPQLSSGLLGDAATVAVLDVDLLHPVRQATLGDPEDLRDLLQRSLAVTGHCRDIVAQLLG